MGQSATAINDRDMPNSSTGKNELINVNINKQWAVIPAIKAPITQNVLYPVKSTIIPNIGEVMTVMKKNRLK